MGNVDISVLSRDNVDEWQDVYPALETKIRKYCERAGQENEFFLVSGASRREEDRKSFTNMVYVDLLDEDGNTTDTTIHGEGRDIASGGLSFVAQISRKKHTRMLLGWALQVRLRDAAGKNIDHPKISGRVVAVRNLPSTDMGRSVHISFDTKLEEGVLLQLCAS